MLTVSNGHASGAQIEKTSLKLVRQCACEFCAVSQQYHTYACILQFSSVHVQACPLKVTPGRVLSAKCLGRFQKRSLQSHVTSLWQYGLALVQYKRDASVPAELRVRPWWGMSCGRMLQACSALFSGGLVVVAFCMIGIRCVLLSRKEAGIF